jgi:hypothetical protein
MEEVRDSGSGNPIVELLASSAIGNVRSTTVRLLGAEPAAPIAPASLIDPTARRGVLELHRLVGRSTAELTFETYGSTDPPPPGRYVLQGWWMQDAYEFVTDLDRNWSESRYDDTGPDFCFLTYESLGVGEIAYTDGRGNWISSSGHELYIVRDVLRLRAGPPAAG